MKRNNAFTLVELLIAVALTSVLAALLMGVVSGAMDIWNRGRNQIDTSSNARQALNRLADELKGAIASNQAQFIENSPSVATGGTTAVSKTSENVFFVAPYPNSAAGDLCVIAYRHNSTTRELQRSFVDSKNSWSDASGTIYPNRYQLSAYGNWFATPANWRTVAAGVLEFEIRSYSQQNLDNNTPADLLQDWDSSGANADMTNNVPRRVLIRIKVIDDKSLARLNAVPATGAAHDRIVAQSAREFTADLSLLPPH